MNNCNWERIDSFYSISEFKRFEKWIESQVKDGICKEFEPKSDVVMPLQKRVFKCLETKQVWVLLIPDPGYFNGSWLPESELLD